VLAGMSVGEASRQRKPEGVHSRRMVELEELDGRGDTSGNQRND
jgi:hypothetical protein